MVAVVLVLVLPLAGGFRVLCWGKHSAECLRTDGMIGTAIRGGAYCLCQREGREHWNPERLIALLEVTLDRLKDTAIVQTWFEGISKGSQAYGDIGRGGARNLPESGPVVFSL